MRKIFAIMLMGILLLCSCNRMEETKDRHPYLSISYTTYDDKKGPEGGMSTNLIYYDIEKDKVDKLGSADYTSQYPLAVYSRRDEKIYFTSKNEKTGKGDELFSLDLHTNEKKQLTDGLFAINFIVPRKNDILLVAVKKGTRPLRLIQYDKQSGKMTFDNLSDNDTNVWSIGLNINNENEFYTATYSVAQGYENAEKQSSKLVDRYYYPDNTLNRYTGDFSTKEKIGFFEKEDLHSISANDQSVLIYRDLDLVRGDDAIITKIDVKTGNYEEVTVKDMHVGKGIAFSPDNKGLYFLGSDRDRKNRGIYYYDLETESIKTIFLQENGVGFINNFMLLYE